MALRDIPLSRLEQPIPSSLISGQFAASRIDGLLPAGMTNRIINGNFDHWQRATTQTTSAYASADRWLSSHVGGSKTFSRQAFTVGQTDVKGNPKYHGRTVVTSVAGAGNLVNLAQRIEDVTTLAGKTITITVWAKADAVKNLSIDVQQNFGGGGSAAVSTHVSKIALTTGWVKYSRTVTLPSVAGKTIGTNDFLSVRFWFDAGTTYNAETDTLGHQSGTFDLARVSVVEGDVAAHDDPFAARHIHQEFLLCARYFQFLKAIPTLIAFSAAAVSGPISWSKMRAAPTLGATGVLRIIKPGTNMYDQSSIDFGGASTTPDGGDIGLGNFTGLTSSTLYQSYFSNNGNYITLDAEL